MQTLSWIRMAAGVMLIGVGAGAFGAHALRDSLPDAMQNVFETGVRYQLLHGLALMGIAWLNDRMPQPAVTRSGFCFLTGIVIFSGSLYILALSGVRLWGAVTPVGGLLLLAGWAHLLGVKTK